MTIPHQVPASVARFALRPAPRSARALLVAALLPLVASQIACGEGGQGVDVEEIESVEVVPSSGTLTALGQTLRLRAIGRTASGDVLQSVAARWTTSDPGVATVDADGVVTAVGEGEATIVASLQDASASAEIVVEQRADRIEVTPAEPPPLTALGETTELSARVVDAEGAPVADASATWRSNDEEIATVDADGVVTAVANGRTTVVAAAEGVESDPIPITVSQVPARVDVSPDAPEALTLLGETVELTAAVADAGGSPIAEPEIVWESSDETVATVDDSGVVTAAGEGESEITATSGGARSEPVPITVDLAVKRVTLSPEEGATLDFLGQTVQLSARAFDPEERPIPEIGFTWVSSDESVATVDDTGLVTAVANGEVTITASAGGTTSDPVPIAVDQTPERVEIASTVPDEPLTALGDSLKVTVEAYDAGESPLREATYEWTSSDESVATVDESGGPTGIVVAVGNGRATITVTPGSTGPAAGAPPARAAPSATFTVEVEQVLTSFELDPSGPITLRSIGQTLEVSAVAQDSRGNPIDGVDRTWKSSEPSVARVSPSGTVTARANGETSITVSGGGVTSSPLPVTVDQAVRRVEVTPAAPAPLVSLGRTLGLSADAFDAGGTPVLDATFSWTASPDGVVSVALDGTVTAVSDGTATVTATSEGVGGNAVVTVRQTVASVTVSPASANLTFVGQTVDLDAVTLDPGGSPVSGSDLTWSSSDESVATVDADGTVTAVGNGSAEVSVTAAAGSPVSAGGGAVAAVASTGVTIMVEQEVDRVEVTAPGPATLTSFGQTLDLTAAVLDAGGTVVANAGPTTWTSSMPGIAAVSSSGVVTAVADGETSIVATAEGVSSAPLDVTVDQRVARVALSPPDPVTLTFVGETTDLTAAAFDGRDNPMARPVSFTWMSDDPAATVVGDGSGSGTVTATANGTANVTATAEGVPSDPVVVTVAQEVVEVEVTPSTPGTLTYVTQTLDLDATARDDGGNVVTGATFTWSSSDENVATVDPDGTVTAVGNGSAEVSVTAGAGSPVSAGGGAVAAAASRGITIMVQQEVDRVVITPPAPSPTLTSFGETLTLTAEVLDAGGFEVEGASASWSSSSPGFATVDPDDGTVTAVAEGQTSITATADGVASSPLDVTVDQQVASVTVTPAAPATLTAIDQTLGLSAAAFDGRGNPMAEAVSFSWASNNTTVAEVDASSGEVTARANGSAEITATSAGVPSDPVTVTVDQEIDQVEITSGDPGTLTAFDDQVTVDAVARDVNGHEIPNPELTWSASPGGIVSLSPTSGSSTTATAIGNGMATITASSDGAGGVAAPAPALAPASDGVSVTVDQVVTSLTVSPSPIFLFTDETKSLVADARDANGNAVSDAHAGVTWGVSDASVATVGVDNGEVSPGSAEGKTTATASADGASADAVVRVIERGWPNEPAGFTTVEDRGWASEGSWSFLDFLNDVEDPPRFPGFNRLVSPGGPFSPSNMLEVEYPEGMTGEGKEPVKDGFSSSDLHQVSELFVGFWWKASADWHNHPSGVNKLLFIWPTNPSHVPFQMRDITPDEPEPTFEIEAVTQFGAAENRRLPANGPGSDPGRVVPGTWHRIEIHLVYSSGAGAGDGIIRWWVDGQLAGEYTDVQYPEGGAGLPDDCDTTANGGFCLVEIAPTWGGFDATATKAQDDFFWFDHTYISTPP